MGADISLAETIERITAHCAKHERSGRAQFSVDGVRRLLEHIAELEARTEWRDMESAPKDGTHFLVIVDGEVRFVAYGKTSHVPIYGFCLADQGAEDFDICKPVAWMPLPLPSAPKGGQDNG